MGNETNIASKPEVNKPEVNKPEVNKPEVKEPETLKFDGFGSKRDADYHKANITKQEAKTEAYAKANQQR